MVAAQTIERPVESVPIPVATHNLIPAAAAWEKFAACAGMPGATQLFFSDDIDDISEAKGVCATCPVMAQCLEGAVDRNEQWGVWGGQLFANGKVVVHKRRRGRPPKHPRPGDQLPMIPFPAHLEDRLQIA